MIPFQSRVPGTVIPLCAAQCERMFNTTRTPGVETGKKLHAEPSLLQTNKQNQELNHFLISSRCAPTLAGQRVCGGVPRGALFPAVGVPGGPAAVSQRDRISDTENPGRLFTTVSWRGETGSSDSWREVAAICNICLSLTTKTIKPSFINLGLTDSTIKLQRIHGILPFVFSSCFDNAFGNFFFFRTQLRFCDCIEFLHIVLQQTIILVVDYFYD